MTFIPGTKLVSTFMIRMLFLGECLATMIVYVWSRRNPGVMYNFFGLFTFQAPYLPWLLLLLSFLFGGSVLSDLVGKHLKREGVVVITCLSFGW